MGLRPHHTVESPRLHRSAPPSRNDIPVYGPATFETEVAGHFTHARHIKEAIAVPRRIVPLIARSLRSTVHD